MKNVLSFQTLFVAAALSLGCAAPAFAGDDPVAPAAPAAEGHGVLGQNYINLGYHYTDIADTGINAHGLSLTMNQGVRDGLDTLLEYNYLRSDETGFGHATQQIIDVGARAYMSYRGVKPFAEAGLGWAWLRVPAAGRESSFLWFAGVGVEVQATPDLTFMPFVRLNYATSLADHKQWDYGVRSNYWLTERVGLTASLSRDNSRDMTYGIGVNIRY
jgi:hypothetical protein